jgi:hypothetical protein
MRIQGVMRQIQLSKLQLVHLALLMHAWQRYLTRFLSHAKHAQIALKA